MDKKSSFTYTPLNIDRLISQAEEEIKKEESLKAQRKTIVTADKGKKLIAGVKDCVDSYYRLPVASRKKFKCSFTMKLIGYEGVLKDFDVKFSPSDYIKSKRQK